MSKKKFKKLKRNKSHQAPRVESSQTFVSSDPVVSDEAISGRGVVELSDNDTTKADDPYANKEYSHVKKDIRKILAIIGVLAVIFIGIFFLGQKTNALNSFGDWIYKVTNIQTQ